LGFLREDLFEPLAESQCHGILTANGCLGYRANEPAIQGLRQHGKEFADRIAFESVSSVVCSKVQWQKHTDVIIQRLAGRVT
jgi:hypothetical protein